MHAEPDRGSARSGRPENPGARREVLRLAIPAFFSLVTEPLFLLADSAIIGHLGTTELAGLGLASSVLTALVGLTVFLAYGTTAAVARRLGAGQDRAALREGIDGLWLAVAIGAAVSVIGVPYAGLAVSWFGAGPAVQDAGTTYLRIAILGAAPMLVVLAATGVLRGFLDTRTPLVVALAANLGNVGLNLLLVYPLGLGIAGSALGSLVAQLGAATALGWVVVRRARRRGVGLLPDVRGVGQAARAGVPLVVRTLTLRACLVLMTISAAQLGPEAESGVHLAVMQLALTIWTTLSFVLDAIAIAAQAMTGRALGAGDGAGARALTGLLQRWGLASGVVTGVLLALCAPWLGPLFSTDTEVHRLLVPVLLVAALFQPLAGLVFLLDGVLIGAGDTRYLAWAGVVVLIAFVPALALAAGLGGSLPWLWVAFGAVFMGGRGVALSLRARGERWMRLGSWASQ